jgi:hypothetical protein
MDAGEYPNNVFYSGIDFKLPGNGGSDCANFLSNWRRVLETIFAVAFSCLLIYLGYQRLTVPQKITIIRKDRGGKRLLLVVLCLVFGVLLPESIKNFFFRVRNHANQSITQKRSGRKN